MNASLTLFTSGMVGFFAYEAIRVYRVVTDATSDLPPWRRDYRAVYLWLLPCLAILSGAATLVFGVTSVAKAAVIGYLFPSGVGSLVGPVRAARPLPSPGATLGPEETESIKLGYAATVRRALRDYFR